MAGASIVLIDTDVFSALYIGPEVAVKRGLPVTAWRNLLAGKHVLISFQTRAEVMAGIRISNWSESRRNEAQAKLDTAHTVGVDEQVIEAFASLTAACRSSGHGLQDKIHASDRWIAAAAIAKNLPLLAGDRIYEGVPGLTLLVAE